MQRTAKVNDEPISADFIILPGACTIQAVDNWRCTYTEDDTYRATAMRKGRFYQRNWTMHTSKDGKDFKLELTHESVGISGRDYWMTKMKLKAAPTLAAEQEALMRLGRN